MTWILYPLVVIGGVLSAMQAASNSTLAKTMGQPAAAAVIVYLVGFLAVLAVSPFLGLQVSSLAKAGSAPWWAIIGGAFGTGYVLATLYATPQIGAGAFVGLSVTAAVLASVTLDHFGWMGLDQHPAGWGRIAGCVLMVAGVALVAVF